MSVKVNGISNSTPGPQCVAPPPDNEGQKKKETSFSLVDTIAVNAPFFGCAPYVPTARDRLKSEEGILLNNGYGQILKFKDFSGDKSKIALAAEFSLPEEFIGGNNIQNLELYLEIGTDSTMLKDCNNQACPCVDGMFNPDKPEVTSLKIKLAGYQITSYIGNKFDSGHEVVLTEETSQEVKSFCAGAINFACFPDERKNASIAIPQKLYADGNLNLYLTATIEVNLDSWIGDTDLKNILYARIKAK